MRAGRPNGSAAATPGVASNTAKPINKAQMRFIRTSTLCNSRGIHGVTTKLTATADISTVRSADNPNSMRHNADEMQYRNRTVTADTEKRRFAVRTGAFTACGAGAYFTAASAAS
ncbi:putative D-isomer specific 2-hydroxyacid dehydro genase [Mycolicibacterium canariasense]|uniref:Putative D-isomer specific 2-hydroxyacid dehydro genase n=1 Tax=Mycolicibacterium canariasense TaxID=228230 RepID=A0A100W832_MYCCR|nr:putative D-isomer specific 2-hydroxyacid dehydro genase [Mycolicibacterium canariasense]